MAQGRRATEGIGLKDNIPLYETLPRFPVHFLCPGLCWVSRKGKM